MGLSQHAAVLDLAGRARGAFKRDGDGEDRRSVVFLSRGFARGQLRHRFQFRRGVQHQCGGQGDDDHGHTLRAVNFCDDARFLLFRFERSATAPATPQGPGAMRS